MRRKEIKWQVMENSCWNITSHNTTTNYPLVYREGRHIYAHRYIYEKHFGKIPEKMVIKHLCNNKACVNPDHLMCDTQQNNILDAIKDGLKKFDHMNKPTLQIDKITGEVIGWFKSASEASKITGISRLSISDVCNGRHKTAGNYIWKNKKEAILCK